MKRIIAILLISMSLQAYAQDMIYDMTYGNRLAMNPAFCGNDGQGKIRATIFHHNQFFNNRGPFHYSSAAIDYGICSSPITFGLIVQNETQGDGLLRTNAASPIIGAIFNSSLNSTISFGLQVNFINYTVDWSRYVFSDQLDPVMGITQPSSNANAGIINDFATGASFGISYTRWLPWGAFNLGGVRNHFIAPRFSLLDYTRKLPARNTVHAALLVKKGQYKINNALEFSARYDNQDIFNSFIVSGGWYANQYCFLGGGARLSVINSAGISNSLKPIIELRVMPRENTKILFSYGFNIAQNASGLGNAFEVGLVYVPSAANCNPASIVTNLWSKNKKKSKRGRQVLTCPTFQNSKIGTPTF